MVIDFVSVRGRLFFASAIMMLVSFVLLAIPPSLVPGIEFTSGTTALLNFEQSVGQSEIRDAYAELGHPEARVQSSGPNQYLIRTDELDAPSGGYSEVVPDPEVQVVGPMDLPDLGTIVIGVEGITEKVDIYDSYKVVDSDPTGRFCQMNAVVASFDPGKEIMVRGIFKECGDGSKSIYLVQDGQDIGFIEASNTRLFVPKVEPNGASDSLDERTAIERSLEEKFGSFTVLEFSSVSPVVSAVAVRNATIAVVVASLFIMAYVAFAFSSVPKPFRYATCAIIALIHDVVIVLGAFSLFGKLFDLEINLMFVTALLTVVGFSVHDSIVVFDRIRENVRLSPHASFGDNVNAALLQTLSRSLNTSLTLLLTVTAMLLLGGDTVRTFLLTILVGVIVGTYSSIAIAAQLLVAWESGDFSRWIRRGVRTPS